MQEKVERNMLEDIIDRIVSILFAIGVLISAYLLAIDTVYAEDITVTNLKEYYKSQLDPNTLTLYDWDSIIDLETFPFSFMVKNGTYVSVILCKYEDVVIKSSSDTPYSNGWQIYLRGGYDNNQFMCYRTHHVGNGNIAFRILSNNNGTYFGTDWIQTSTSQTDSYLKLYGYPIAVSGMNGQNYGDTFPASGYGDLYLPSDSNYYWCKSGTYVAFGSFQGLIDKSANKINLITINTNNTPGFDCYKLDTKGGIYFYADFSSLISLSNAVGNSSTFSCDFHLDDTVQTVTLDSTSEYYQYDVAYCEAEYVFPITAFVPNYTEYNNVWIDNIKVVNTTSSPGGPTVNTFVYISPIVISGTVQNDNITSEQIPQVTPKPDTLEGMGIDYYSGEELKRLYDNNMFNQWITESEFYNDIAELGGGRSVKLVGATDQNVTENNVDNTLAYLENVAAILEGTAEVPGVGAIMTVTYGVNAFIDTITAPRNNGQIDFNSAAESYIRDNLYSSTYDIIILEAYYDAEALQTNTQNLLYTPIPSIDDMHAGEPYTGKIFYVILTQRYIESLNLDGIGSIQKLLESDVYYVKVTYEYLYDRLNDFETKTLTSINNVVGVENNILDKVNNIDSFLQRIEGILNKIFDALKSINIEPTDTTAIETKLDNIYNRLGNSNMNNDWYKRYREWLYDETNDNIVNTPHEYMLNTFDDVKALFDVFAYFDIPETGFWSSAREYLNRMNGNTYNDNINDYIVTGIASNNFYKDNCNTLTWSDIE